MALAVITTESRTYETPEQVVTHINRLAKTVYHPHHKVPERHPELLIHKGDYENGDLL